MLGEASYYARMMVGLYRLLRTRPPSDAEGLIRSQRANRETIFLETARRVIFTNHQNPYHQMFRLAGCRYEDLAEAVRREGLESTLAALHRQGVYLTHDEFKGRTPILRSRQHLPSDPDSFSNPLVSGLLETQTSGSRSMGTRTRHSTEFSVYREAYYALTSQELGIAGRAHISLWPILPSEAGLTSCLIFLRLGQRVERWYAMEGPPLNSVHYRALTNSMVLLARLMGNPVPFPVPLPPNDFAPVAEWIARRCAEGHPCVVSTYVSPAVRVAVAARETGLDIRGTVFRVTGEALTEAKRAAIEAAGAEVSGFYWISEVGPIGYGCRQMRTGNCVHLLDDSVAAITHRRQAPFSEVEVNSLLFTTLLPFAPHVLINAEMDDNGILERAHCNCVFSRAGFGTQIRDLFSFGKLTGQGMTLLGTDLVRILEEVLPARLGGHPGNYQLVEHEGQFQTQLDLRVSPRTGLSSAEKVRDCFLSELRRFYGGTLAARVWQHAEAVQVVVAEPFATATGKVLPLHLLGPSTPRTSGEEANDLSDRP